MDREAAGCRYTMSTLSKETIEATHPEGNAVAPEAGVVQPSAASAHLHSDAVSLEVPIKVHGSKVASAAGGGSSQPEPFEEQTTSMIVFPHGGVLRMSTPVNIGQMLVLTNLKSRQDAICRVVKVRSYSASSSYVEVEFTHRQAGYWGVLFASDEPAQSKPAAPSEANGSGPSVARTRSSAERANSKPPVMPAGSVPANPAPPARQDSAFVPLGSSESVQPSASPTMSAPAAPPARLEKSVLGPSLQNAMADAQVQSLAGSKESKTANGIPVASDGPATQAQGEDPSIVEGDVSESPYAKTLPLNAPQSGRSSGQLFGVALESEASTGQDSGVRAKKNWMLIAACAAGFSVAAGGGYLLLHHRSGGALANAPQRAAAVQPPATPEQSPAAPPAEPAGQPVPVQPSLKRVPQQVSSVQETQAVTIKSSTDTAISVRQNQQPAQAAPSGDSASPASSVPSMFGALNAHPVSTRKSDQSQTAAPTLETGAVSPKPANILPGIAPAPTAAVPLPTFQPAGPVPVGGPVKEPKVVSRVLPVYPPLARQARTEGDVVLDIVIDKSGKVSALSVISGPPTLRQAALDAVRHWRYEPTVLNGQPISVQTEVTIRFRQ
jgi:TonB family protein